MATQIILVFILGMAIDIFYVGYISAVTQGHKIKAGAFSVMLAAPALFGYISVYDNRILCIPYFLGLFFGTILAMKYLK